MTGYRAHSFDPNAYEQPGRPMRPFRQLAKNRRVLLIAILACAAILGAALVIEFIGAN
jgi:hypothetical protein